MSFETRFENSFQNPFLIKKEKYQCDRSQNIDF